MFKRCLSKRKQLLLILLPLLIVRPILSSWIGVKAGEFFDLAIYGTNFKNILWVFIVIFLAWLFNYSLIFYWTKLLKSFLVTRFRLDTKNEMFHSVMNVNSDDFNTMEPGDYIAAFSNDITLLETRYFQSVLELFEYIITIIIVGSVFFTIDSTLAGTVVCFGLLGSVISIILAKYTRSKNEKFIRSFYSFTQGIKELFSSFRTIKNYNITTQMQKRFEDMNNETENKKCEADFALEFVNAISAAFSGFLMFSVIGIGLVKVLQGDISMGIVITAYNFASDLSSPLQNCLHKVNEIRSVKTIVEKIDSFNDKAEATRKEFVTKEDYPQVIEKLSYKDVSYSIGEKQIINNFSFEFEKGKKYLIIGKNGAGKSTLFKLLKKSYDTYTGGIYINDTDIAEMSYEALSDCSSYLNEDVSVYSATVKENIELFREVDETQLSKAISVAQVKVDLDRKLKDNGSNISSGEKRRIEIARTLVKNTPIIVFDEVISTLDIETAYEIEKLALNLDSTVIFISHNFSGKLVKDYDEILLLEAGSLIAHGSHEDLLGKSSDYKRIWRIKNGSVV
mgnify:CR=1 FL=1